MLMCICNFDHLRQRKSDKSTFVLSPYKTQNKHLKQCKPVNICPWDASFVCHTCWIKMVINTSLCLRWMYCSFHISKLKWRWCGASTRVNEHERKGNLMCFISHPLGTWVVILTAQNWCNCFSANCALSTFDETSNCYERKSFAAMNCTTKWCW